MKLALFISLATATLTYFGLSRWMPETSIQSAAAPAIAATDNQLPIKTTAAAPMKVLEVETVQVSHSKYLPKHGKKELPRAHAKSHAEEMIPAPDQVAMVETAPIVLHSQELDLSLPPEVVILPKAQLTRVAPLILQKKNPS